jgi:hypothetical protein
LAAAGSQQHAGTARPEQQPPVALLPAFDEQADTSPANDRIAAIVAKAIPESRR